MHRLCLVSNPSLLSKNTLQSLGKNVPITAQDIHNTILLKFPVAAALKLPTNVVDINSSEMGRFSPLRDRDISGPVINSCYQKQQDISKIDVTTQMDPHLNKYDCRGAVSLSSSMQSNVPSPFTGNHTHLGMPGSQWGQGHKYLSDHLNNAHYLTLRNEYRDRIQKAVGTRQMSTNQNSELSTKDKLKKAVKEYGSTVIVFHVGISLMSLGSCYLLISSGVDLVAVLKYFNIGEGILAKAAASNAGTFVIAYAVHKCFAPVRIGITLTATPFIVRYLRKIGFIKNNINAGGGNKNMINTPVATLLLLCLFTMVYVCNSDMTTPEPKYLFDFTKTDDVDAWTEQSDTVRDVGMSKAVFVIHKNLGYRRAIFFALLNPQQNGAGFAGIRALKTYDLSKYSALELQCRGQGQFNGFKVILRHKGLNDEPNYSFEQFFQAPKEEFAIRNLKFSEFKPYYRGKRVSNETLDTSQISSIGIQMYGGVYQPIKQKGPATLEVDWIRAV